MRRFEEFCKTNRRWIGDTNEGPARDVVVDIKSRAQSLGTEAWFEAAALIAPPRLSEKDEATASRQEPPADKDEGQLDSDGDANTRDALVNGYIREVEKATGVRITKSQIWRGAEYRDDTTFLRWRKGLVNGTPDSNFRRVLQQAKPHLVDPTKGRKKPEKSS